MLPITQIDYLQPKERLKLFAIALKSYFSQRQESRLIYLLAAEIFHVNDSFRVLIHRHLKLWDQMLHNLFQKNDNNTNGTVRHILSYLQGAILLSNILDDLRYFEQFIDEFCSIDLANSDRL